MAHPRTFRRRKHANTRLYRCSYEEIAPLLWMLLSLLVHRILHDSWRTLCAFAHKLLQSNWSIVSCRSDRKDEGWRTRTEDGDNEMVPRGGIPFYDIRQKALNCGKRFVVVFVVLNIACHKHAHTLTNMPTHPHTYTHTQMNWIKLDSLSLCKQNFNVFLLLKSFTQTQVELCSPDSLA